MRKFDFTKQLPTHCSDKYEKEYFLIFSIIVAGRNAKMALEKAWRLLEFTWGEETPFDLIKHYIDHNTWKLILEIEIVIWGLKGP